MMRCSVHLPSAVPEDLGEEFLKRLAYVSEGLVEYGYGTDRQTVDIIIRPEFEHRSAEIADGVRLTAQKICSGFRPGHTRTLARQDRLPTIFDADPHPLLEQQNELIRFGRGQYGFGPRVTSLMRRLDSYLLGRKQLGGWPEYSFPAMIGSEVLDRCRYLKNFPASVNLVSHLREDLTGLQRFASNVTHANDHLQFDSSCLGNVETLLSPSVCFHWYNWLRHSSVKEGTTITAWGKCFRYESTNLSGLERLWDFSMREMIFVGSPAYVSQEREQFTRFAAGILDDLGLAFEISSATDPFFIDTYAVQTAFQQGFELKFELLCPLPYSGRKLAVGSINYHQDFFGRTFEIEAGGEPAHTGCIGFGLERLALAILAQFGVDEQCWPAALQRVPGRTYAAV